MRKLLPSLSILLRLSLLPLASCRPAPIPTAIAVVPTDTPVRTPNLTPTPVPTAALTPAPPTATAPPTRTPTPAPSPAPPIHRIGIRMVDRDGELYNRITGDKFILRGTNYGRLAEESKGKWHLCESHHGGRSMSRWEKEYEQRQLRPTTFPCSCGWAWASSSRSPFGSGPSTAPPFRCPTPGAPSKSSCLW